MKFSIEKSIEILERTPTILESYLNDLSQDWIKKNEGENTWSPYDIIGHLVHGEKTDWIVRLKVILNDLDNKQFEPFDRFAQMSLDTKRPISELLKEFRDLREMNLNELKALQLVEKDFKRKGIHPELGEVSLTQLISTWVVHDMGHIAQISRVMAKQYESEVGPWVKYLGILKK